MSYTEKYKDYSWIKVPRYEYDTELSVADNYFRLDSHHIRETTFLIEEIRKLAAHLDMVVEEKDATQ